MRAGWLFVGGLLSSCGRIAFDPRPLDGAGSDDASPDVAAATTCGASPQVPAGICANLVSAYLFDNASNLGFDATGPNHMLDMIEGVPMQSTDVPAGLEGHSLLLDGASSFCIASGFTFDATQDHTLCWWTKPTVVPVSNANQFAQFCAYDTWADFSGGPGYRWTINNCSATGTQSHFVVPNVYTVGQWVQICQTFESATLTRRVRIAGQTYSIVDSFPIDTPSTRWCIGSYGGAGYWTGLIYKPMWFNRILSDGEISEIYDNRCCQP